MANSNAPFNDFFKLFSDFKAPAIPALDMNSILSTQRRNAEAVSAAGQRFGEGLQAIFRHQTEAFRDTVESTLKASKDLLTSNSPETSVAKQADLAKTVLENTLSNLREVSQIATKSNMEAFDVLNKRVTESLDEISKSAAPAKKKAA